MLVHRDTDGDGRHLLAAEGELDIATAEQLRRQLAALPVGEPVVLDLADITFIDSTGLALLLSASQAARENGATLMLRHPSMAVRRLIALTGVGEMLVTS